jgi:peptide/nickel transport system substrate-binding protein
MRDRSNLRVFLVVALALTLVAGACGDDDADTTTSAAPDTTTAPDTTAAREIYVADCTRAETLIVDIDGGPSPAPDLFNPFVPGVQHNVGIAQALYEPLFLYSIEAGKNVFWLAESMEPNDTFDVWTLKLREGTKWSDGEVLDADDVVWTTNMLKENSPELENSDAMASWVADVVAVDDRTVRFDLTAPLPTFLNFFNDISGDFYTVPEHIWADKDPFTYTAYDPDQGWPITSGAYRVYSQSPAEFVYTRDDNWWGAESGWMRLPAPRCVMWIAPGTFETKAGLMINNELDSLMDIDPGTFEAILAANPNVIAWRDGPPWSWVDDCQRNLEINHMVEPWGSAAMRTALTHIIDRDQIVDVAYLGTTAASRSMFPAYPTLEYFLGLADEAGLYEQYPIGTTDLAKATTLLEGEGYEMGDSGYWEKDGERLTLNIQTASDFVEYQRLVSVIIEQLQAFGIDATMTSPPDATVEENYLTGNFEGMMNCCSTCSSMKDPWPSMDVLHIRNVVPIGERANDNGFRWANQEYSDFVDLMAPLTADNPAYEEAFLAAFEIYLREVPVIPLVQARKLVPFDTTYWTGWPTTANPYYSPTFWWFGSQIILHTIESTGYTG